MKDKTIEIRKILTTYSTSLFHTRTEKDAEFISKRAAVEIDKIYTELVSEEEMYIAIKDIIFEWQCKGMNAFGIIGKIKESGLIEQYAQQRQVNPPNKD